jgi:tRNA(adenine34) deaminase
MRRALRVARASGARGEVPVGAVAVRDGTVIASAGNAIERRGDATAHAEMLVLRRVASIVGGWRLDGVTVYATLEPCPMCAGAIPRKGRTAARTTCCGMRGTTTAST